MANQASDAAKETAATNTEKSMTANSISIKNTAMIFYSVWLD